MRAWLLAAAALVATQPLAARVISSISYAGVGTIAFSSIDPYPARYDDPRRTIFAMPVGTQIPITGSITFDVPYIDEDATGTFQLWTEPEDFPRSNSIISDFHVYGGENGCIWWSPTGGIAGYPSGCGRAAPIGAISIGLVHGHLRDIHFAWSSTIYETGQYLTATEFSGFAAPRDPGLGYFVQARYEGSWALRESTISITTVGVPEPANWALMIAGFGVVGMAQRRRWAHHSAVRVRA